MGGVRIFLHSVNTGTGGGATLLNELLVGLDQHRLEVMSQLDSRVIIDKAELKKFKIDYVKPNILSRIKSELKLKLYSDKYDLILCFGSLPPLFHVKRNVVVFVQNRYLVDGISLRGFKLTSKCRIFIERLWLRYRHKKNYKYVVQTESMRVLLARTIQIKTSTILKQQLFSQFEINCDTENIKTYDFIYVASGEPHKNHRSLIEAWIILAKKNIYPSLCLTLDPLIFNKLLTEIAASIEAHRLNIFNVGHIPKESMYRYYVASGALIYPSLLESFGLPLIEAGNFNLPILASELDYVRDVVVPSETFNPYSPLSIARAVMRYLHIAEDNIHLISGKDFIQNIFECSKN